MNSMKQGRTLRETALITIIVLFQSVFVLVLFNSLVGGLRFTSPKANYQAFAVAGLLPILACAVHFAAIPRSRRGNHQWVSLILSLLGLSALFVELFVIWYLTEWFMYPIARAPDLRPKQVFAWKGSTISVWELFWFDDTPDIIIQDVKIAGPIKWRRQLASFSRADVTVAPVDSRRLRCKVLEAGPEPPDYEGVEREVILEVD